MRFEWGIYTMLNCLAYLCEHFNVAPHSIPQARHELVCAESVISLPVKRKKKEKKKKDNGEGSGS